MNADEFLSQYIILDVKIKAKEEQLQELRTKSTRITTTYSDAPTHSNIGNVVSKIADLESEIIENIDKLLDIRNEIANTIDKVEDTKLNTLLELRYINGKTYEKIAEELYYNLRTIYRTRKKALHIVEKILSESGKNKKV